MADNITPVPEWTPIPGWDDRTRNSGVEMNKQGQALANRAELLKQRVEKAILTYPDYAAASAAAATLPDGQVVDVEDEKKRYRVQAGVLVFVADLDVFQKRTVFLEDYFLEGETDAAPAFRRARDAAKFGATLILEEGKEYSISSPVELWTIGKIAGNNATIKPTASCIAAGGTGISLGKRLTTYSGFTKIPVIGNSKQVSLPATVPVAVDDLLLFLSDDIRIPSPSSGVPDYFHGMWGLVTSVNGSVATILTPFYESFNVTSIIKYKVPKGASVHDLNFDLTNTTSTNFAYFEGLRVTGVNTLVRGCTLLGNDYAHVGCVVAGEGATVSSCTVRDFRNIQGLPLPGRVGYGVGMQANNTLVTNNTLANNKHGATANERTFVVVNPRIIGNEVTEDIANGAIHGYTGSLDMHCNVAGRAIIDDNHITSWSCSVLLRNKKGLLRGNTLIQAGAAGILINGAESGFDGVTVHSNRIFLDNSASSVMGNYGGELLVLDFKDVLIKDNYIRGGRAFCLGATNSVCNNVKIISNDGYNNTDFVIINALNSSIEILEVRNNSVIDVESLITFTVNSTNPINKLRVYKNIGNSIVSATSRNLIYIGSASANSKTTTFNDLDVSGNELDNSLNTGNLYAVQVVDGIFNRTNIKQNTIVRGSSNFRSLKVGRGDFYGISVSDNNVDTSIIFESSSVPTQFRKLKVCRNTAKTITQNESSADCVFFGAVFLGNISDQIIFDNRSGSTAWASSSEVLVSNNQLLSATDSSVYIGANSVGHKINISGNTCGLKPFDASATYGVVPRGNSILSGANQSWKGGTTVNIAGELFAATAPTTGAWLVGDRVYHLTPAASGYLGWVCVAAGTPGTWKNFGVISA